MNGRTTRFVAAVIASGAIALPLAAEAQVYGQAGVQVGGGIGAGVNVHGTRIGILHFRQIKALEGIRRVPVGWN